MSAYQYYGFNRGQLNSPFNVTTGTVDIVGAASIEATNSADIVALQSLMTVGATITTTMTTDLATILANSGSVIAALGTVDSDVLVLANTGASLNKLDLRKSLDTIEAFVNSGSPFNTNYPYS